MPYTDQVTYDNLSLQAITVPVSCKRMTIRELASDASPVSYNIAAPASSNAVFPKLPLEATVFEQGTGIYYPSGATVGYIQLASGSAAFSRICE